MAEKYTPERRAEVFTEALKVLRLMREEIMAQLNYETRIILESDWEREQAHIEADKKLAPIDECSGLIQINAWETPYGKPFNRAEIEWQIRNDDRWDADPRRGDRDAGGGA